MSIRYLSILHVFWKRWYSKDMKMLFWKRCNKSWEYSNKWSLEMKKFLMILSLYSGLIWWTFSPVLGSLVLPPVFQGLHGDFLSFNSQSTLVKDVSIVGQEFLRRIAVLLEPQLELRNLFTWMKEESRAFGRLIEVTSTWRTGMRKSSFFINDKHVWDVDVSKRRDVMSTQTWNFLLHTTWQIDYFFGCGFLLLEMQGWWRRWRSLRMKRTDKDNTERRGH